MHGDLHPANVVVSDGTLSGIVDLTGGDRTGQWKSWYEQAIPRAEELYAVYLRERAEEEGR